MSLAELLPHRPQTGWVGEEARREFFVFRNAANGNGENNIRRLIFYFYFIQE
jgi:hypothetical protein